MKIFVALLTLFLLTNMVSGQVTTSPEFPQPTDLITFTVDVTGTDLENYSEDVWIWAWLPTESGGAADAPTNVNPATEAQSDALMTQSGSDPNIYTITFTPTDFFGKPASEIEEIGLLLKGRDWSDGQTPDYSVQMSSGGLEISLISPADNPLFVEQGATVSIEATVSDLANITIKVDGNVVNSVINSTEIAHNQVAGSAGRYSIEVIADNGDEIVSRASYFIVRSATVAEPIPDGVLKGINYSSDETKVTLCLWAPMKTSVYAIGSFSDWEVEPAYQMKKDGELFWVEIDGLIPGKEYPFQYLVDEQLYIADPYADKILDPEDQYIPNESYPDLIEYPTKALREQWYFNRLSVLQTGQTDFNWTANSYQKPDKNNLVIYELLIRDFFEDGHQNYNSLIDTLSYLSDLGVNAIELMPIMEFNGNNSWGYNPTFMFAPDKFYGTKNKLKAFVDEAHKRGIAVILDIAMNHNDIPAPYALMYFDFNNMKPSPQNPWFNTDAKHPFNVFYDYNHESSYTQNFLDSINNYWLSEYKVDGFRFDLSKGFTQKNSGADVSLWSSYDASRIAILERMADKIWQTDSDAYVILEHLGVNEEEKELANYGMMLWGNMNEPFSQNTMGYSDNSNIGWGLYTRRDWSEPNLVTYMESHDEERVMYKNLTYGNQNTQYSAKKLETALSRTQAASAFLYLTPGPKMLWQFGELGYDFSINTCEDLSISNDCRLSKKPIPWAGGDNLNYTENKNRIVLKSVVKELIKLKTSYSVFSTSQISLTENGLIKVISLENEENSNSPANADEMNAILMGNFNILEEDVEVGFLHTGKWFDYFSGDSINVADTQFTLTLNPGEYKLFTDVKLPTPDIFNQEEVTASLNDEIYKSVKIYPNPFDQYLEIKRVPNSQQREVSITDLSGKVILREKLQSNETHLNTATLPKGMYVIRVVSKSNQETYKVVKR